MADTWYGSDHPVEPRLLVAVGSCAKALSFEPATSRAKTLAKLSEEEKLSGEPESKAEAQAAAMADARRAWLGSPGPMRHVRANS
jgi:hypothetical protein